MASFYTEVEPYFSYVFNKPIMQATRTTTSSPGYLFFPRAGKGGPRERGCCARLVRKTCNWASVFSRSGVRETGCGIWDITLSLGMAKQLENWHCLFPKVAPWLFFLHHESFNNIFFGIHTDIYFRTRNALTVMCSAPVAQWTSVFKGCRFESHRGCSFFWTSLERKNDACNTSNIYFVISKYGQIVKKKSKQNGFIFDFS